MNEDDIVDFFTKNRYHDRWDEERWQEQMEEHPFFMSKPPENPEEIPPLVEAIRQLKYDELSNKPVELAHQYKLDGNHNYKNKKFQLAIECYNKGLSYLKDGLSYEEGKSAEGLNPIELKSILFTNRAACLVMLNKYREAVDDCIAALRLNPQNVRARKRMEETLQKMKK